jgi:hypothetical protein
MPIRADLRKFYGREWYAVTRPRILRRAGGRFSRDGHYLGGAHCENCEKPDRKLVYTFSDRVVLSPTDVRPFMFWLAMGGGAWRNQFGKEISSLRLKALPRKILVILSIAHLNHVAGDDRDENLKALCAWCHLHHDSTHHRETRCARKDADRPLLVELMPRRDDFADELDYCRAMQRWAVEERALEGSQP